MSQMSVDVLIADLRRFTDVNAFQQLDLDSKDELYELAKKLALQVESPNKTCDRLFGSILVADIAQVAVDLKVFRTLAAEPEKTWTVSDLSAACGVDASLLHRLLRYLAADGYVTETGTGTFQASSQSIALSTEGAEAGLKHNRLTVGPPFRAMPRFFQQTSYANPTDANNTLSFAGHGKNGMDLVLSDPELGAAFFTYMKSITERTGDRTWLDTPAYLTDFHVSNPDRPLFVDVGGGAGGQCLLLRQKVPEGRIILQDMEMTISQIDQTTLSAQKVEAVVHDFFEPQPATTQGAKIFYLKNVLHDWADPVAVKILGRLVDAMAEDSVVIIDETLMPPRGASFRQAGSDMIMMILAAQERTVGQWTDLLGQVGLKIRDVWTYQETTDESLIVAVKK